MNLYNLNQKIMPRETKLYRATFDNLKHGNKMFRAYDDYAAAKRAGKISTENGYGKVSHIYEIHERTHIILRSAKLREVT